jgi:hypothetical protein
MTVPATTRRAGPFNGNGSATSFPFTFKVFSKEDIQVELTDTAAVITTLVLDSDYSVAVNSDQDASPGGTVTYPISGSPLVLGAKLVVLGALENEQTTDLPAGGAYRAKVVEDALDRTVIQVQQLAELQGRALTLPASAATADTTLPAPESDKLIGWNTAANALINLDPTSLATVIAFGTANANQFTGNGSQVNFTLTSNPGALANLDVSVGGVTQLPTTDYTWSGTTLTFTTAPPNGAPILARYLQALPQGTTDSDASTWTPGRSLATTQRMVGAKLRDQLDLRDWVGMDFTGNNDCSSLVQAALGESASLGRPLMGPAGTIVLGAPVDVPAGASIALNTGPAGGTTPGTGRLFFHITHTGRGFTLYGQGGARRFQGIGTKRTQPTPGAGFTPNSNDWDFYIEGANDIYFDDVMLLNPTNGIVMTGTSANGAGRLNINRVMMQPLLTGVQINASYDVTRITDLHMWPFWSQHTGVRDYMQANVTGIYSLRNDNPIFDRVFSIWAKRGLRIGQWAGAGGNSPGGTTSKLKLGLADFDVGTTGYSVDVGVSGHTAYLGGLSVQGRDTPTAAPAIECYGSNCDITVVAPRLSAGGNAIRCEGSGNTIRVSDPTVEGWNLAGGGWPAFEAYAGNKILVTGAGKVSNGSTAPTLGSAGTYSEAVVLANNVSGIDTTGASNSTTALANLFGLFGAAGGTVQVPNGAKLLIDSNLTIPPNCHLVGPHNFVGSPANNASAPYGSLGGVLMVNSAATITLSGGATMRGLLVYRKGMTFPAADASAFAGTAVTVGGDDAAVERCMILGFNKACLSVNYQRPRFDYVFFDCVNGIEVAVCYDVPYITRCHGWPFATIATAGAYTTLIRTGIAFNLRDTVDWAKVTDCFSWGYYRGLQIANANNTTVSGGGFDNAYSGAPQHANSIGVVVSGTSQDTRLVNVQTAAQASAGIYVSTSAGLATTIINHDCWGGTTHAVLVDSGDVMQLGGVKRGVSYGLSLTSASSRIFSDKNRFQSLTGAPYNPAVATTLLLVGDGNDYGDFTGAVSSSNSTSQLVATASALTLPNSGKVFGLTGATTITSLANGWPGREVVLIPASAVTMNNGTGSVTSVKMLAGANLSMTANVAYKFAHSGGQWYQI